MIYGFEDYYRNLVNGSSKIFKGNGSAEFKAADPGVKAVLIREDDMKLFYPFMSARAIAMSKKSDIRSIGAVRSLRVKDGIDADIEVLGVLSFMMADSADDESAGIIKWLYVADSVRDRGIGKMLLGSFFTLAKELGAESAFAEFEPEMEYEPLAEFLAEAGFYIGAGSRACLRIPAPELSRHLISKKAKYGKSCISLGEIDTRKYHLPNKQRLDQDISCAIKVKDGEMLFLTGSFSDNVFTVESLGPCKKEYYDHLAGMLLCAADGLLDKYGKDAVLSLECRDKETMAFLSLFFPERLITRTVKAVSVI